MSAFFYGFDRLLLAGAPVSRWIQGMLLFLALVAALNLLPGRWFVAGIALMILGGFVLAQRYWRRRQYITFREHPPPRVTPAALDPSDKLPLFASGLFGVEGKEARFTWLQGFFRTFATREHAIICLVPPRRLLLARWPEHEVGMWYIFFQPGAIRALRYGVLTFDGETLPGLAIDRVVVVPKQGRFRRAKTMVETVYLACPRAADVRRILADLLHDQPRATRASSPSPNGVVKEPVSLTHRPDG